MKLIEEKLIKKKYFGNGFLLEINEIAPSMLVDYNKSLLKIWKFLRAKNYNISVPIPSILSIDFDGGIFLNSFENISKKTVNTPSINIYFKYFVNKIILLEKNPMLVYFLRRANFVDAKEVLFFPGIINKIVPYSMLLKASYSKIAPLIILKKFFISFLVYVSRFNDDRWIDIILKEAEKKIYQIKLNNFFGSWTNYYANFNLEEYVTKSEIYITDNLDLRQKSIFNILKNLKPDIVLDVASNKGMFSLLAARAGHSVISVDNDISTIDYLYNFKKKYNLPIIPAVLDFNELSEKNIKRFKSSYVLALGFTHHLYLVEQLSWDFISRVLSKLTKKVLITEFKPDTAAHGSEKLLTKSWKKNHTLKNYLTSLKKYFKSVELLNENLKQKRIVILCEK